MGTVFPRQSDNMKLFAVLALAAVAFAEPEAEADPALLYGTYGYGVPAYGAYGAYGAYSAYRPYSYGAYPYAYGAGYGYRTYGAYGAYPYASAYYGKRSAEAEPEAEADPAVLYSTASIASPLTTAYTAGVAPLTTAYTLAVTAPLAYTHAIAPVATTVAKSVVPTVAQYTIPSVYSGVYGFPSAVGGAVCGKRSADAEADPALLYTAGVAPLTTAYTAGVAPYAVAAPYAHYAVAPVATVAKAPAHGVAATYAGLVHSSHVGVCLNNVGVQVPC